MLTKTENSKINYVDITSYVHDRAEQSTLIVHDIDQLPQQLLAAVANAALNKIGGLSFCFESKKSKAK